MSDSNSDQLAEEIKVQAPQEVLRGAYANQINISHSAEEFIIDFLLVTPPTAMLNARTMISPANAKRLIAALTENVSRYEAVYGPISVKTEPLQSSQLKTH